MVRLVDLGLIQRVPVGRGSSHIGDPLGTGSCVQVVGDLQVGSGHLFGHLQITRASWGLSLMLQ